eukprot:CAMPEP_0184978546 /NCGR_PEP_ID=MMETSP1098-20130426/9003_1 /TAXON_ID=89044 /ORGANISM="Spumella elongata, Strain CCAP 955/1" /LENGTH=211 /DNA_ID=CAMNT_0027501695 /DNA_START=9 /DNA_END=644 /DNA_ORIENTATION=+
MTRIFSSRLGQRSLVCILESIQVRPYSKTSFLSNILLANQLHPSSMHTYRSNTRSRARLCSSSDSKEIEKCDRLLKPSVDASVEAVGVEIRLTNQTISYPDGTIYEGDLVNGKRHGYGKSTTAEGTVYEGDWENDLPHGNGSTVFANGSVYTGEFRAGKRWGDGTLVDAQGTYKGRFENDQKHGRGVWMCSMGHSGYSGMFKHDKPQWEDL